MRTIEVPLNAGKVEDLLQRRAIGLKRKAAYSEKNKWLLDTLRKVREATVEEGNPKRTKIFDMAIASYEEFHVDLNGVISSQSRADIFTEPVGAMHKLADNYGVAIPSTDELLSRLLIVDRNTFLNISLQEYENDNLDAAGLLLPNRLCLINAKDSSLGDQPDVWTRNIAAAGVHELWHSVEISENWDIPPDISEGELRYKPRRQGLFTSRPPHRDPNKAEY